MAEVMQMDMPVRIEGNEVYVRLNGIVGEDILSSSLNRLFDQYEGKRFILELNSEGGTLLDGLAIYDEITTKGLDVEVRGTGIVGSAATAIASASDRVLLSPNSFYFIHSPYFEGEEGNNETLAKYKDKLLSIYEKKVNGKLTRAQILELMDGGDEMAILTAQEAINYGFADGLLESKAKNRIRADVYNKYIKNEEGESYTDYPESATNAAKRALDYLEESGNPNGCLTLVGFKRANQLAKREAISFDTVKRIAQFNRFRGDKDTPYTEGCGGIAWDAWGGTAMIDWSINKVKESESKNQIENKMSQETQVTENNEQITMHKSVWARIESFLTPKNEMEKEKVENRIPLRLKDGTEVYIEPTETERMEPEVGDKVLVAGEPAPDGEHETDNGLIVVTEGGVIKEIKEIENGMGKEEIENLVKETVSASLEGLKEDIKNMLSETVKAESKEEVVNEVDETEKVKAELEAKEAEIQALQDEVNKIKAKGKDLSPKADKLGNEKNEDVHAPLGNWFKSRK